MHHTCIYLNANERLNTINLSTLADNQSSTDSNWSSFRCALASASLYVLRLVGWQKCFSLHVNLKDKREKIVVILLDNPDYTQQFGIELVSLPISFLELISVLIDF